MNKTVYWRACGADGVGVRDTELEPKSDRIQKAIAYANANLRNRVIRRRTRPSRESQPTPVQSSLYYENRPVARVGELASSRGSRETDDRAGTPLDGCHRQWKRAFSTATG